jgi:hypothetical protein
VLRGGFRIEDGSQFTGCWPALESRSEPHDFDVVIVFGKRRRQFFVQALQLEDRHLVCTRIFSRLFHEPWKVLNAQDRRLQPAERIGAVRLVSVAAADPTCTSTGLMPGQYMYDLVRLSHILRSGILAIVLSRICLGERIAGLFRRCQLSR